MQARHGQPPQGQFVIGAQHAKQLNGQAAGHH
jgi:hypothetical protein